MPRIKRRPKDGTGWWSESQRVEAVQSYILFGKLPSVEAVTGIPRKTLANWKLTSWWKDLEKELRESDDIELSGRLKKVIDKSLEVLSDRLENGDYYYDQRAGELRRKPVNMRDAHVVLKDTIDKRRVLDNKPTHISESRTEDKLAILAQKFDEFARSFRGEVIEVKPTLIEDTNDALHEEREA